MKFTLILLFAVFAARSFAAPKAVQNQPYDEDGGDNGSTTTEATTTTEPSTTTTEAATTTTEAATTTTEAATTTTEAATTTTEAATTTTEAATTTTEAATTTTEAATTPTEAATTTTEAATTTTEAATTTTEADTTTTSKPDPSKPDTSIEDNSGKSCLLVSLEMTIDVTYETIDNEKSKVAVKIPTANAAGACAGGNITVENEIYNGPVVIYSWNWPQLRAVTYQNKVVVQFSDDEKKTSLSAINATISLKNSKIFPNASKPDEVFNTAEKFDLSVSAESTFECTKATKVGSINVDNLKFQSGSNLTDDAFGKVGATCGAASITFAVSLLLAAILSSSLTFL